MRRIRDELTELILLRLLLVEHHVEGVGQVRRLGLTTAFPHPPAAVTAGDGIGHLGDLGNGTQPQPEEPPRGRGQRHQHHDRPDADRATISRWSVDLDPIERQREQGARDPSRSIAITRQDPSPRADPTVVGWSVDPYSEASSGTFGVRPSTAAGATNTVRRPSAISATYSSLNRVTGRLGGFPNPGGISPFPGSRGGNDCAAATNWESICVTSDECTERATRTAVANRTTSRTATAIPSRARSVMRRPPAAGSRCRAPCGSAATP